MGWTVMLIGLLAVVALVVVVRVVGRTYWRFRGTRLVTCPETDRPAAVEVNARHAAVTALLSARELRLRDCSRWPERNDCGQECLRQIEAAPEDCLLRSILTRWYEGKTCAYCGKPFPEIHWLDNKPALLSPARTTVEWREVRPELVPEVLGTHRPVCWDCHIAETFRRLYPDLVVDRDPRWFEKKQPRGERYGH